MLPDSVEQQRLRLVAICFIKSTTELPCPCAVDTESTHWPFRAFFFFLLFFFSLQEMATVPENKDDDESGVCRLKNQSK